MSSDDQLKKAVQGIFDKYDKDKSGTLDSGEIKLLIQDAFKSLNRQKKVTDDDVQQFIKAIDKNGDKQIAKGQLFQILKKLILEGSKQQK